MLSSNLKLSNLISTDTISKKQNSISNNNTNFTIPKIISNTTIEKLNTKNKYFFEIKNIENENFSIKNIENKNDLEFIKFIIKNRENPIMIQTLNEKEFELSDKAGKKLNLSKDDFISYQILQEFLFISNKLSKNDEASIKNAKYEKILNNANSLTNKEVIDSIFIKKNKNDSSLTLKAVYNNN